MAYHIGQIRYSSETEYLNEIDYNESEYEELQNIEGQKNFNDYCISINNSNNLINMNEKDEFLYTKSYYLNFAIKQSSNYSQKIFLKLKNVSNMNTSLRQQLIQTFVVTQSLEGQEKYISFEVIVSPNEDFPYLVWELQRIAEDYREDNPRKIEIKNLQIYEINNQNPRGSAPLQKIGIQGPPLMLMCINKQPIRIGRSGIYEVNNGIDINFIGFINNFSTNNPNSETELVSQHKDFFFMDYQYLISQKD